MQLKVFRTLWGFDGSYTAAVEDTTQYGFDGIEGPVPTTIAEAEQLARLLEHYQLDYIAEIATTGSFVPDRRLTAQDHITDLAANLERLKPLPALFITCLGGCDAWPLEQSIDFLDRAAALADSYEREISFETHRGRSLYNPWHTREIVDALPALALTCDYSHWNVVCEGLQETEEGIIDRLVTNAHHIHARVGYDQGPQVPDPRSAMYADELNRHLRWWKRIWQQHREAGRDYTTVTPEFGTDGYDHQDPATGVTLIAPDELNRWMMGYLRNEYEKRSN